MAEDHRLQDLACQKLEDDEQDKGEEKHFPTGPHGGSEYEWKDRRDERADVRHEPQDHRDKPPQWRGGYADQLQTGADRHAEGGVEGDLRQKKSAQSFAGFVERRRRPLNVVRARQTDETIPQVLTLYQDEDHEDDDDAGRRE